MSAETAARANFHPQAPTRKSGGQAHGRSDLSRLGARARRFGGGLLQAVIAASLRQFGRYLLIDETASQL
jgi:hypothetical protein